MIEVDPAKGWVGLNFYSPAAISIYAISIDQHQMYVYAVDGNFIEPQLVDQLLIPNGNRYSVLVKLDQPVGDYTIHFANGGASGINQIVR